MKVVGIITEYNPFHHGHHFQLQAAKQETNADVLVVLMSGNVVQRGEFSILDKWQRSQLAIRYGADLVLELPLLASLQSADYFAKMGVELLAKVGCDTLVFGTETATQQQLQAHVDWLEANESSLQHTIQTILKQGFSYAAAMQMAIDQLRNLENNEFNQNDFSPMSPNHLLGIQYLKANKALDHPMDSLTLTRIQSVDEVGKAICFDTKPSEIKSGSQIRQLWRQGALTSESVPSGTFEQLNSGQSVEWEDYWLLLKYRLTSHRPESLRNIFGIKEGLEYLLLKNLIRATDFKSYRQSLISKRWTMASVQRILMAILLDIQKQEWEIYRNDFSDSPLLRILGYNQFGRLLLKDLKKKPDIELFSNYTQKYKSRYDLMLRADQILAINPRVTISEQNFSRYPEQHGSTDKI